MAVVSVARAAVVALLALGVAASEVCTAESAEQGVCQDVLNDASSLLSVAVELHNFGKTHAKAASSSAGDDDSSLMSVSMAEISMKSKEATVASHEGEQLPGLGGIVGGIAAGIVGGAVQNLTGAIANQAASGLASALNNTLGGILLQADSLLQQCAGYRNTIKSKAQAAPTLTDAFNALETQVNTTVGQVSSKVTTVLNQVSNISGQVISALNAAGQQKVATQISKLLSQALQKANKVTTALTSVPGQVAGLETLTQAQLQQQVPIAVQAMNGTVQAADQLAVALDTAFADVLSQATTGFANMVPGTNATQLLAVFDDVILTEQDITQTLVLSLSTLALGIEEALKSVVGLATQAKSAGTRAGALLALGVAAVAAALAGF